MATSYSLNELAKIVNAQIIGDADSTISGIAPISTACKGDLTYLVGGSYRKYLSETNATAVMLTQKFAAQCKVNALIVKNPEVSFAKIANLFDLRKKPKAGIHTSAVIGENCKIDPTVSIGAKCVIGDDVSIKSRTVIMPGTVIGEGSQIGEDCILYSNVTLYHQISIGSRVVIHAGSVIGADGFGYAQDDGQWVKIPQLGRVVIEDDVEIGANVNIDRGALINTIIHRGVKIDNSVQIGHNVEVGEHTIIAGCTGIAGSVKIGRHCMIGGGVGINGHITIDDQVIITGRSSVLDSLKGPGAYSSGVNVSPHVQWFKTLARIHQLDDIAKRLKKLEKK